MMLRSAPSEGTRHQRGQVMLAIGALGVVYGDLGTSPLYAVKETFTNVHHRLPVDRATVLGAVSMILWTLILLIAVKYVTFVLRADNDGEGGILALTALVTHGSVDSSDRRRKLLIALGLFGTALLYGDGMITPAISVLSAVEGTRLINPGFRHVVIPLALAILIGLFAIQRFGTGRVGRVFGPVMLVWFATMAIFGIRSLAHTPEVLQAFAPVHAVRYFQHDGRRAFLSMGSLFLVVTGGEALYADMGHFGRRPITTGWFAVVMPALMVNYLGAGALLLRRPDSVDNPFLLQVPPSLRVGMVVLATVATVIASQALISGVFSLTLQAIKLGYAPRTKIVNTSHEAVGQIYVPMINWALMLACVGLVLLFRSSSALASAYGVAVTGTMFITTLLFAMYARQRWHWNRAVLWTAAGVLLLIEGSFLVANLFKIPEGGWSPVVVALFVFTQLTTWKTGRAAVDRLTRSGRVSVTELARSINRLAARPVTRVPGTAVYLFSNPGYVPASLLGILRATGTLHEHVYIVAVVTDDRPVVPPARRERHAILPNGFHEVTLHYGFMEPTPVAADLQTHLGIDPTRAYYFLGRETVTSTKLRTMARWREALFVLMKRNVTDVGTWFQLPPERVLEVGARVEI